MRNLEQPCRKCGQGMIRYSGLQAIEPCRSCNKDASQGTQANVNRMAIGTTLPPLRKSVLPGGWGAEEGIYISQRTILPQESPFDFDGYVPKAVYLSRGGEGLTLSP